VDTGRVIEFEDTEQEKLMEQIATRLGFDLVSTRLEIYGRRPAAKPAPQPASRQGAAADVPAPPQGLRR
jgi:Fur family ferric uptake transcriptional regulator